MHSINFDCSLFQVNTLTPVLLGYFKEYNTHITLLIKLIVIVFKVNICKECLLFKTKKSIKVSKYGCFCILPAILGENMHDYVIIK